MQPAQWPVQPRYGQMRTAELQMNLSQTVGLLNPGDEESKIVRFFFQSYFKWTGLDRPDFGKSAHNLPL